MANRWGKIKTVKDFIFLGSKITTDGDCSHEIKRHLVLGRKAMTNLDSIFKSRDYFANKGLSSQSYGFTSSHVWMWDLDYKESWAPKNWWFWTWCWRRMLRIPWAATRSNQSILKEISPGCSLEGLMLKLKLQYFGHLMQRADSFGKKKKHTHKNPDFGKDWRQEEKRMKEDEVFGWHHQLNGHKFG